ncbi:MAG: hypothetical protein BMS9Abin02_0567 [Anaerolineae bacterium]|nr:MAG: hypothetical protein BMS9Abin02_0567 [Anaerolineae bacterium]
MRFIIREQDSERLLAAGLFSYLHNGQYTGVTEEWRLTDVLNRYRILRIDIDARESKSEESTLFHMVLNRENQPERLKIRFFSPASQGWADLLMGDNIITLTQEIGHQRWEDEVRYDVNSGFLFSSAAWLGYWIGHQGSKRASRIIHLSQKDKFELVERPLALQKQEGKPVLIGGRSIPTELFTVTLSDKIQNIWIDKFGLTLKAAIGNGFTAVETRYIRRM